MLKKVSLLVVGGMLALNLSGCVFLLAGVAGGAGTAIWLSGKLTQEFHATFEQTIDAAKEAVKTLNLKVTKETREEKVEQIKGNYTDGREVWIDIHKISETSTRVEVRVGAIDSDKKAASVVLKEIQNHL